MLKFEFNIKNTEIYALFCGCPLIVNISRNVYVVNKANSDQVVVLHKMLERFELGRLIQMARTDLAALFKERGAGVAST